VHVFASRDPWLEQGMGQWCGVGGTVAVADRPVTIAARPGPRVLPERYAKGLTLMYRTAP